MKWAGHVANVGDRSSTYHVLVKKSEGKKATWKA